MLKDLLDFHTQDILDAIAEVFDADVQIEFTNEDASDIMAAADQRETDTGGI